MKKRGLARLEARHELGKIRQLEALLYLTSVVVIELLVVLGAIIF